MKDVFIPSRSIWAVALAVATSVAVGVLASSAAAFDTPHRIVVAQAEKPSAQGTIDAVDASHHRLKITHGPVSVLNWPGMTMDFDVAPAIDVTALKPGMKIDFTLGRGDGGAYVIDHVRLAE